MTEEPRAGRRSGVAVRLAAWGFFVAFVAALALLLSRSLQPRMPGMPATGGTMTTPPVGTPSSDAPNTAEGDGVRDMPGMNKP